MNYDMDLQERYESELRDSLFDSNVNSYTPAYGDLEKFITNRAKESLKLKNRGQIRHGMNK